MITCKEIKNLLSNMTDDSQSNAKRIINLFGSLEYTDEENQSILHILVDNIYDEDKCFLAIKSLLKCGLDPNLEADFHYNNCLPGLYAILYSRLCIIAHALGCHILCRTWAVVKRR